MHDYDARAELEKLARLTEASASKAAAAHARGCSQIASLWERASRDYADSAALIAWVHRHTLICDSSHNKADS